MTEENKEINIEAKKHTESVKHEKVNDSGVADEKQEDTSKKKIDKKIKRTEAIVRAENIPISTKDSMAVCRHIKWKTISRAIKELEMVIKEKKAISIKGEHAHKKGKKMSGGIYPKKVSKNFIILLKSLAANASDITEPVIVEAVANIGERPYGRFGKYRKKRTNIYIKTIENKLLKKDKGKKEKSH